ncbi:tRNA (adenosine(37)-N6)-threonylcarbamoyltransferase complex ATPase subunit type 1 TsaE [Sphingobacterium corticis]|uniref:tRNA threonylcarbamoyladenosine biosynthesis protein TsaE n=1 Tax=Sphingobacterium corticis TaxID=1812823 RepID=A0ABW5NIC8_9SPHI
MEYLVENLSELGRTADEIVEQIRKDRVILFYGDMGAGKTTLIKEICRALGVSDNTSSPTFSIVNEYDSENGSIYHFDFYRLRDEQEAFDLGYEEYLYSGNYCFIEWPDKISNLLPTNYRSIRIEIRAPESRNITLI